MSKNTDSYKEAADQAAAVLKESLPAEIDHEVFFTEMKREINKALRGLTAEDEGLFGGCGNDVVLGSNDSQAPALKYAREKGVTEPVILTLVEEFADKYLNVWLNTNQ